MTLSVLHARKIAERRKYVCALKKGKLQHVCSLIEEDGHGTQFELEPGIVEAWSTGGDRAVGCMHARVRERTACRSKSIPSCRGFLWRLVPPFGHPSAMSPGGAAEPPAPLASHAAMR
jgi:hypothetical protein